MWRILLTRRWIVRHVIVLVIVGGCVTAGFWQIARLHQVRQFNAVLRSQMRRAPSPLVSLLPPGRPVDAHAVSYHRVVVSGTYDTGKEVLAVGRSLNDIVGNDVLTPLFTSDGRAVIVDRGWIPYQLDRVPVAQAAPPGGTVTVTGVLFPSEVRDAKQSGAEGVVTKIDPAALGSRLGVPTLPVFVWLQSQTPRQTSDLPSGIPLPPLSDGPHFGYAVQWFLFASVGIVGYPVLIQRELTGPSRRRRRLQRAPASLPETR